jgi:Tol biopolymer transport system component
MKVINLIHVRSILIIILLINVGCQSTKFLVITDPPKAKVKLDGKYEGETPINIELKKGKLELSKDGYRDTTIILSGSINDQRFSAGLSTFIELLAEGRTPLGTIMLEVIENQKGFEVIKIPINSEADIREKFPNLSPTFSVTNLSDERWIGNYTISPDGNTIVMEIYDQYIKQGELTQIYSNLWSINLYQSVGMTRITQGNYFDRSPSFSPDGQFIYYSSNRVGNFSLWRIPLDRPSNLGELLTSESSSDNYPQISPDGTTILYTASNFGSATQRIWSAKLGSIIPNQITAGENGKWSPDGKQVLYTKADKKTGNMQIWKMNYDGSSPMIITQSIYHNEIQPSWSPDGSKIVFASDEGRASANNNYDIWLMNNDGSNRRRLTTNGSRDDLPNFSPDGKTIYFRSNRGIKWNIWEMKLL